MREELFRAANLVGGTPPLSLTVQAHRGPLPTSRRPPEPLQCPRWVGLCIERPVVWVIGGDTLEVDENFRIRLVLVDAPKVIESGGPESRDDLTTVCQGSRALIDEDDFQVGEEMYGRVLAAVRCGGTNANAPLVTTDPHYDRIPPRFGLALRRYRRGE